MGEEQEEEGAGDAEGGEEEEEEEGEEIKREREGESGRENVLCSMNPECTSNEDKVGRDRCGYSTVRRGRHGRPRVGEEIDQRRNAYGQKHADSRCSGVE
jgi:hypothetical protein